MNSREETLLSLQEIVSDLFFILRDNSYYIPNQHRRNLKLDLKDYQRHISRVRNNYHIQFVGRSRQVWPFNRYSKLREDVIKSRQLALQHFNTMELTEQQQKRLITIRQAIGRSIR